MTTTTAKLELTISYISEEKDPELLETVIAAIRHHLKTPRPIVWNANVES